MSPNRLLAAELEDKSINRQMWRSCVWVVLGAATVLIAAGLWRGN